MFIWTDAGTGKQYRSINQVNIPTNINKDYATVHVYPNDEAEIIFSNDYPTETKKGLEYKKKNKKTKLILPAPEM